MDTSTVMIVFSTLPSEEAARDIITKLVTERLVACGTLLPSATSIYQWKGSVQVDSEVQVILKTSAGRVTELLARITELHPYDVPEVLAVRAEDGLPSYLDWVRSSTSS